MVRVDLFLVLVGPLVVACRGIHDGALAVGGDEGNKEHSHREVVVDHQDRMVMAYRGVVVASFQESELFLVLEEHLVPASFQAGCLVSQKFPSSDPRGRLLHLGSHAPLLYEPEGCVLTGLLQRQAFYCIWNISSVCSFDVISDRFHPVNLNCNVLEIKYDDLEMHK